MDVIVAAWSAEATLARALRSALAQPEVRSVIVVDDASPDATSRVALSCDQGDGRLVVLRQDRNAGPSAARNRAIAAGSSEWIAILDADDFMRPGRIGRLLELVGDCDIIGDDVLVVDEGREQAPPRPMFGKEHLDDAPLDLVTFVLGNVADDGTSRAEYGFIKPLMRRAFLEREGLRYDERLRLGEDYDLYARALAAGAVLRIIPAQGYVYVQRAQSLSGSHASDDLARLRDADLALLASGRLTAAERRALLLHYRSVDCRLQWRLVIDAWKVGDALAVLRAFGRSRTVALYLAARLWEQAVVRTGRRLRLRRPSLGSA